MHIESLEFTNDAASIAYLRIQRTLQVNNLRLERTTLLINRNQKLVGDIFTYGLMIQESLLIDAESVAHGTLSFTTMQIRMYEVISISGYFQASDSMATQAPKSQILMGQLVINVPSANVELTGSITCVTNNLYQGSVFIVAGQLVLGSVVVRCNYFQPPRQRCCGGSMKNFGGCSYGTPHSLVFTDRIQYLHPIQGTPGDQCTSNKTVHNGSESGGFIMIRAISVQFKSIESSGSPAVINETDNGCGGAGSGGYVELQAGKIIGGTINVSGGGCDDKCTSGGAGSTGVVMINGEEMTPGLADKLYDIQTYQDDGACKYAAIASEGYCNAFMELNNDKMTCKVPLWLTLVIMLIGSVVVAGIVSTSVNVMTWFRNKYA